MKLPPSTLRIGTKQRMKTTSATNAVAGYRHGRELAPADQAALQWNDGREEDQNDAAERGRLVDERRLLAREVDDLRRIDIKSPRHAEQQLGLEAAEDADHAQEHDDDNDRRHHRHGDAPHRRPGARAGHAARLFER